MGELSRMRHRAEPYGEESSTLHNHHQSSDLETLVFVEPSSNFIEIIPVSQIREWHFAMPRELLNRSRYELRARTQVRRQEAPALLRVVKDISMLRISSPSVA